jgi:alpha-aminoadipate carrier protein LysW
MPNCPECGGVLELSADVMAHEIIDCPACGTELEVVSVEPIKIALAPEEEEDWGE